jgi:alanine racemase
MLVMVKAAGYGAGPAEIARLLEFHKIDYLGVAYTDEGIELRQAGVQLPILVLNPEPSGYDALYRYRLEPEIYNQTGLDALIAYLGEEKRLRIHLKLDTGMRRLGFVESELPAMLDALAACSNLEVATVFSHLAGSDSNLLDQFTREQAATFERMYRVLTAGLGYAPDRHLANTGAIVRFPEYHYEMVRLGIGIYGVDTGGMQRQLQPVHTLKATISQIKSLQPGETVGYNRNGCVERSSRIATISIGYADGLLRLAGNGRYQVALRGRRVYG